MKKKGKVEDLYACTGKYEEKGKDNYTSKQKLKITHTNFQKSAYILKLEAKHPRLECIYLAFTASNRAKELGTGLLQLLLTKYSSVEDKEKGTLLTPSQTDTRSNDLRKGILQAQLDYEDSTKGATFWDGTDFLAWGLKSIYGGQPHAKFRQYKKITINKNIYQKYLETNLKEHKTVRYGSNRYSIPAQVFLDTNNWKTGNFEYITKVPIKENLVATTSGGCTIFWKVIYT